MGIACDPIFQPHPNTDGHCLQCDSPGTPEPLWERACSRRGQYIRWISSGEAATFVSKLTPTGTAYDAILQPHPNTDGYGLRCDFPATPEPLWERACSRRGQYIRWISSGEAAAFVSKLTPTGTAYDSIFQPHPNTDGHCLQRDSPGTPELWERACSRRGQCVCVIRPRSGPCPGTALR